MMYLLIDIGNTLAKVAVIKDHNVLSVTRFEEITVSDIISISDRYPEISGAAIASVRGENMTLIEHLKERYALFLNISSQTAMPIDIDYDTPTTLGVDRLLSAVGASFFKQEQKLLVIDFGSAITIDIVSSKGIFLGGNISPGMNLRFRSLNLFTKKLPLCNLGDKITLFGKDTTSAIVNGVVNGIMHEISGYIQQIDEENELFSIFFTGGDGKYFADKFKRAIFVESNLALIGMYEVLEYNLRRLRV